jgi:hypothetical protein
VLSVLWTNFDAHGKVEWLNRQSLRSAPTKRRLPAQYVEGEAILSVFDRCIRALGYPERSEIGNALHDQPPPVLSQEHGDSWGGNKT